MIEPSDTVATVVFTCSATELGSLDINVGPCVSHQPGKPPLVSPAHQRFGDEMRQVADLYRLFGGASDPWESVRYGQGGVLTVFATDFQSALASVREGDLTERLESLSGRWLRESEWPRGMQVGGVRTRLATMVGFAGEAKKRVQSLYCWRGPSVAVEALTSGPAGTYENLRKAKRYRK